jgi:ribonuclease VapC
VIIDTSALVAASHREQGWEALRDAMLGQSGLIPAPVIVELYRVTGDQSNLPDPDVVALIDLILSLQIEIASFDGADAQAAITANPLYGSGNHKGGLLNMLELMVYGMSKARGLPILFTGNDFATTDALIHPASRIG